ncbi:cytochrome c biogenesis CcdA family protein [Patescibacteria group bacterium]
MVDLKLTTVLVTALIDSINPCAIGVLVLLISTLLVLSEHKKKLLITGAIYVGAVFVTYFLAGLGLLTVIHKLQIGEMIGVMVGFLVIFLGFVEIKDFFWYGKGFSLTIPSSQIERVKKHAANVTIPGAIILGIIVSAVELPCTGGPYLAITTILAEKLDWTAFWYLFIYNLIFVLPLAVIVVLAYFGTTALHIKNWKEKYKKWMRLFTGLLMVGLGVLLILFARGDIVLM